MHFPALTPLCCVAATACLWLAAPVQAQRPSWVRDDFPWRQVVPLAQSLPSVRVAVVDLYLHGQLAANGRNLAVYARDELVPFRVLQIGPGDLCRVAFQPDQDQPLHQVYYGGSASVSDSLPPWTAEAGLLLETRSWRQCDLNQLASVRGAWDEATRLGCDYVSQVFHRHNPFVEVQAPFLSFYRGSVSIPTSGKYLFFSSSQDCSFLLIDGQLVVAAPGVHRAEPRARVRGEVELPAGPHRFEYYHAASTSEACMVAAWQKPGDDKPEIIPAAAFSLEKVARVEPNRLENPRDVLPDFRVQPLGEAAVEATDQWLVRTEFTDITLPAVTVGARLQWDFGDGQSSQQTNPSHIYLHPGIYAVTLTVQRGGQRLSTTQRVAIVRPILQTAPEAPSDSLHDYLAVLARYDAARLGGTGLLQLVHAWLEAGKPEEAVRVGTAGLKGGGPQFDDASRWSVASLVGRVLRDNLIDAGRAIELWTLAGQQIQNPTWRAQCALEAADLELSQLLQPGKAKVFLDFAQRTAASLPPAEASRLHRIWGDWHARAGEAAAARQAYRQAADSLTERPSALASTAWRGAHSRSVEAFLRDQELDRAWQELLLWEREFPLDKTEGYLSLLLARYWIGRAKPELAIAVASDLIRIAPDSPYADALLWLTAQCEEDRRQWDRAKAVYQSLLTDYPGSPLVTAVQERLRQLQTSPPASPSKAK